jgi:hypothetical protein
MTRCKTCRHWDARFPQNPALGYCGRLSVILFDARGDREGAVALMVPAGWADSNPPTREQPFPMLRTVADFGCIAHEPKA